MVRLFFLNTEGSADILSKKAEEKTAFPDKTYEEMLLSRLPEGLRKRIENTNNAELRADRILTYNLLFRAVETEAWRIYPEGILKNNDGIKSLQSVIFDEGGKPRLKDSDYGISISHTDGLSLAAIAYRKGTDVGADVELINERSVSVATRFISRYAPDFDILIGDLWQKHKKLKGEDIFLFETSAYGLCEAHTSELIFKEASSAEEAAVLRWCATEALLKAEGGGFASIKRLKEISKSFAVRGGVVMYKQKKYAVAYAEKKL